MRGIVGGAREARGQYSPNSPKSNLPKRLRHYIFREKRRREKGEINCGPQPDLFLAGASKTQYRRVPLHAPRPLLPSFQPNQNFVRGGVGKGAFLAEDAVFTAGEVPISLISALPRSRRPTVVATRVSSGERGAGKSF